MLGDLDGLMEKYEIDGLFTYGSPFNSPNLLWLTGFRSGDRIFYLQNKGEQGIIGAPFNTLDRVKKESFVKRTFDMSELAVQLLKENKPVMENRDVLFAPLLKEHFTGQVIGVPDEIPASILVLIQNLGYEVKVVSDLIPDARATKTSDEIKIIKKAGDATVGAISRVVEMIKDSNVGANKTLMYDGKPLTVGQVKLTLEHFLLDKNTESAEDTILAVGEKAFDWHYLGNPDDELKAEVPIILDVFPRLKQERYVADVTRTIVKGTPSKRVKEMFEAAQAAEDATVDALTHDTKIDDVNLACFNTLKQHGFDSRRLNPDAKDGMTHGLGHGIGLEVHEQPSMYKREAHFAEGHIMAIEPGVYLEGIGGVRIENDYAVTKGKAELLTRNLDAMLWV
ncbi:MAG: aminopeptidase P family protein [Candidatus Thorarchaeota archaeon]|nr:aminopeptidase P family protein [Candidatus Thorarchaeota archaeon]